MATIVPHLWFDKEAKEAAKFYTSLFPDSKVENVTTLRDTPSGDADVVSFTLAGHPFMAISAGPLFKFTPAISFILNFDPSRDRNARKNLDAAWQKLSEGGKALMPIDKYPFSERYGWIEDRYGLTWQLMLTDPKGDPRPFLTPSLLFVTDGSGKAEEATKFYLSVFKPSKRGSIARYPAGSGPDEGNVMFTDVRLGTTWLAAMDSAREHGHAFGFNEAVSLMVPCKDQKEIDRYWKLLSAVPEAEQCGWLKDKFGVSWQVVPSAMARMMSQGTPAQVKRVTQAFLPMKKFDLAALERAYVGNGKTSKAKASPRRTKAAARRAAKPKARRATKRRARAR